MKARVVVGDEEKNGSLWCSPSANTSRPTCSACLAMVTTSVIRSASVGVRPVVGSVVMSLTVKIPNCMTRSSMSGVSYPPQRDRPPKYFKFEGKGLRHDSHHPDGQRKTEIRGVRLEG